MRGQVETRRRYGTTLDCRDQEGKQEVTGIRNAGGNYGTGGTAKLQLSCNACRRADSAVPEDILVM